MKEYVQINAINTHSNEWESFSMDENDFHKLQKIYDDWKFVKTNFGNFDESDEVISDIKKGIGLKPLMEWISKKHEDLRRKKMHCVS